MTVLYACTYFTHVHLLHTCTYFTSAHTSRLHLLHTCTYFTPAPTCTYFTPAPTSRLHTLHACTHFTPAARSLKACAPWCPGARCPSPPHHGALVPSTHGTLRLCAARVQSVSKTAHRPTVAESPVGQQMGSSRWRTEGGKQKVTAYKWWAAVS